ncbi:hypothetical protein BJ875DRAFT_446381 [Amylocarpus encephaloides]|uniref:Uncharacterized protein n=1 Tax=Amylocarpus encephaloides TaxID=45428 RepID=A0A9P8C0A4_9HELO|nr:hypothetical protein BJ875DRAFT_446381 [Amylocarpus encephaloides]
MHPVGFSQVDDEKWRCKRRRTLLASAHHASTCWYGFRGFVWRNDEARAVGSLHAVVGIEIGIMLMVIGWCIGIPVAFWGKSLRKYIHRRWAWNQDGCLGGHDDSSCHCSYGCQSPRRWEMEYYSWAMAGCSIAKANMQVARLGKDLERQWNLSSAFSGGFVREGWKKPARQRGWSLYGDSNALVSGLRNPALRLVKGNRSVVFFSTCDSTAMSASYKGRSTVRRSSNGGILIKDSRCNVQRTLTPEAMGRLELGGRIREKSHDSGKYRSGFFRANPTEEAHKSQGGESGDGQAKGHNFRTTFDHLPIRGDDLQTPVHGGPTLPSRPRFHGGDHPPSKYTHAPDQDEASDGSEEFTVHCSRFTFHCSAFGIGHSPRSQFKFQEAFSTSKLGAGPVGTNPADVGAKREKLESVRSYREMRRESTCSPPAPLDIFAVADSPSRRRERTHCSEKVPLKPFEGRIFDANPEAETPRLETGESRGSTILSLSLRAHEWSQWTDVLITCSP